MVKKTRRKRFERRIDPKGIRITSRDKKVIEAIYHHRVLTTHQIKSLLFPDVSRRVAERRLEQLFDHGYVVRKPYIRADNTNALANPNLYLLGKKGNELLLKDGYDETRWTSKDNSVGYEHLEHLIAINNCRVAITLACDASKNTLQNWIDDTTLKQDYDRVYIPKRPQPIAVIPDAYLAIETPHGTTHFFLEVDRVNMVSSRYMRKIQAYLAYHGLAQKRYGTEKYRVLNVTLSKKRMQALLQATQKTISEKDKLRFWFTVLSDLSSETVLDQPVWYLIDEDQPQKLIRS